MAEVQIEGLRREFKGARAVVAVDDIDLCVKDGELLVLLGPSGCGKTTLLRCVAGLETPDAGAITIGGEVVFDAARKVYRPPQHRDIGMVFQAYALWPHLTVRRNVEFPLKARRKREGRAEKVTDVLRRVQCDALGDRLPAELSGGQQQRVALARALVSEPAVLLLDEPLSNLDALLRHELRTELRRVHREIGYTGIYVTHDQSEAFSLADRVVVMRRGQVEQVGRPVEVYESPASPYVANFLGIRNHLVLSRHAGGWHSEHGIDVDEALFDLDGTTSATRAELFIRPEHVTVTSLAEGTSAGRVRLAQGRVRDALYGGESVDYVVDVGSETIYAQSPSRSGGPEAGEDVIIWVDRDRAHVFGAVHEEGASS